MKTLSTVIAIGFIFLLFYHGTLKEDIKITDVSYGWAKTSVNAVIFRQNSLVSHGDFQYIAFYKIIGD